MNKVEKNQSKDCTYNFLQEDEVNGPQYKCICNPETRSCCTCLWKQHWFNSSDDPCILNESIMKDQNGNYQDNTNCIKWRLGTDLEGITICEVIDIIPESYSTRDEYCKILKNLIAKYEIVNMDIQQYMNYFKVE